MLIGLLVLTDLYLIYPITIIIKGGKKMAEKIYLMDPLPYGGNVLPFIITNGDNYSFRVLSGIFDFRDKNQPSLKRNKLKYCFGNESTMNEAFHSGSEPLALHYGRLNLYNLIEENFKGLLNPKDKINLSENNISALLILISASVPKRHQLWIDLMQDLFAIGCDYMQYTDLFIENGGNCWRVTPIL